MGIDTFRTANKFDAEVITQLVNQAYRPASELAGWTHESDLVSGNRISAGQVTDILSSPNSVILVGLKDSTIMACVHVEKVDRSCHIGMLAVLPNQQGAGDGKQMLAYAESYANEFFGAERAVMVVVSLRGELIDFYLRRGYQRTGAIMDYPLSANAGTPKYANLKVEVLEKHFNVAIKSTTHLNSNL
ncbi:MAG: GNAT family N-acetyltransferase [Gallionella sp.]